MTDITLQVDGGYFIYKVGAIIIHNDSVLMVKNEKHPYYYTVGGRVQFGETSEQALLREVYEETHLHLKIDRLAFIHENCFVAGFLQDAPCHEIALYYLMRQSEAIRNIECKSRGIDGGTESLHWLPLTRLSEYPIFPTFYKTELQNIGNGIVHFITQNNKTIRAL